MQALRPLIRPEASILHNFPRRTHPLEQDNNVQLCGCITLVALATAFTALVYSAANQAGLVDMHSTAYKEKRLAIRSMIERVLLLCDSPSAIMGRAVRAITENSISRRILERSRP